MMKSIFEVTDMCFNDRNIFLFSNVVQGKTTFKQYVVHVITCTRYFCSYHSLFFLHCTGFYIYNIFVYVITCTKSQLVHVIYTD